MTNKLATIERIHSISVHPNADKLELAKVLNYQVVVQKGTFTEGELVVFVQPDSVIPTDKAWAQTYLNYLTGNPKRVRAVKLRKEWSFGMVVPLKEAFLIYANETMPTEGADVTELMGITKHEPKLPNNADAAGGLPYGIPRTDEDRWQNLKDEYFEEFGPYVVTRKRDGSSFTAYVKGPEGGFSKLDKFLLKLPVLNRIPLAKLKFGYCSRSLELKDTPKANNNWKRVYDKYNLKEKLKKMYLDSNTSFAIRGEIFGNGINASKPNKDAKEELQFEMFNIYFIDKKRYMATDALLAYGMSYSLPLVERDDYTNGNLTKMIVEGMQEYVDKKDFEGYVVKSLYDGDKSFKIINRVYDSSK